MQAEETRTGAIALVETEDGYRNIAEICATPELAPLMIGSFDLSVSMGYAGDWRQPVVRTAVKEMVRSGTAAGLPVIMPVFAPDPAECRALIDHWRGEGVTTFVIGSDKIIIAETFAQWTAALS